MRTVTSSIHGNQIERTVRLKLLTSHMDRTLRKDPIVEAICTFRFDSEEWDWTVPGLLWGQLKDTYPLKQQFEMIPQDAPDDTSQTLGVVQFDFWRRDKTALVRIEPNQLSIIQMAPYIGWPRFKQVISDVLDAYKKVVPAGNVEHIVLRYANRIPVPKHEFEMSEYMNIYPIVPTKDDYLWGPWMQQSQMFRPDINVKLVVRAGLVLVNDPEVNEPPSALMVLDLKADTGRQEDLSDREFEWLEKAHQEIEDMFFACLTPSSLAILHPEENHADN